MKAEEVLSQYSQDRNSASSRQVIESIFELINRGAVVQVRLTGYHECTFCSQTFKAQDRPRFLTCKHQTHDECLLGYASFHSNGTLDPQLLVALCCPLCQTPISHDRFISIVSQKRVDEIMAGATMEVAKQIEYKERKEREEKIQNREYECGICMKIFKIDEMITLDCNDHFCQECVNFSIMAQIGEGKFKEEEIVCPGCLQGPVGEHLLRNVIGAETTAKLIHFRRKHLKVEGIRFVECKGYMKKVADNLLPLMVPPKKDMTDPEKKTFQEKLEALNRTILRSGKPKQIAEDIDNCPAIHSFAEGENDPTITCAVCHLQQCTKGCPVTHPGQTCEQYKETAKLNQMEDGGLEELRRAGLNVVKCPNPRCGTPIERISGCAWVRCRCGFEMCYICKKAWEWNCVHGPPGNGHPKFNVAAFMARYK